MSPHAESPGGRAPRFGLNWQCPACGRRGRLYDVLCSNCWQPRPLLPMPQADLTALFDHPFVLRVVIPAAERAMADTAKRAPAVIDTLEALLRQLQPLALQLREHLPNVAEVSAPQARLAAEQLRWITEVGLPWLETAFNLMQSRMFQGLPDWSVRTDARMTMLNQAFQAVLQRLDRVIDVLDRAAPGWWQAD